MQAQSKIEAIKTTVIVTESSVHEIIQNKDSTTSLILSITICMVGSNEGSGDRKLNDLLPWNILFSYDGCLLFKGEVELNPNSIEERSPKPGISDPDAGKLSAYYKEQAIELLGLGTSELVSEEDGSIAMIEGKPAGKILHQLQQRWASDHSPLNSHLNMVRHFEVKFKSDLFPSLTDIRVVPKFADAPAIGADWFSFSKDGEKLEVFAEINSFKNPDLGALTVTVESYGSLKKSMETLKATCNQDGSTPKPLIGIDLAFLDSLVPLFDIPHLIHRFFSTFKESPATGEIGIPKARLMGFETMLKNSIADQLWLTSGANYWSESYDEIVKTVKFKDYETWAIDEDRKFAHFLIPPPPGKAQSQKSFATTKAYLDGLIAGLSSNVFLSVHALSLHQDLILEEFDEASVSRLSRDLGSGKHLLRQKHHAISFINLKEIADLNTKNFLDKIFIRWKEYLSHQIFGSNSIWNNFGPTKKTVVLALTDEEQEVWNKFLEYCNTQIDSLKSRFTSRDSEPANAPRPVVLHVTSNANKSELLPSEEDGSCRFALFIKDSASVANTYSWRSCNWALPSIPSSGILKRSMLVPVDLPEVNGVQTSRVYLSNEKSSLVASTELSYGIVETHSFKVTLGKDVLKRDDDNGERVHRIDFGETVHVDYGETQLQFKCSKKVFAFAPINLSSGKILSSTEDDHYWILNVNPPPFVGPVSFEISSEAVMDEGNKGDVTDACVISRTFEGDAIVKLAYASVPTIDLQPVSPRDQNDESDKLPYFIYGRTYNVSACRIPRSGFLPSFLRENATDDCVTPKKVLSVETEFPKSGSFKYLRDVFVHPFRLKHAANEFVKTKDTDFLTPFESMPDVFPITYDLAEQKVDITYDLAEQKVDDSAEAGKNRLLFVLFPGQRKKLEIHRPVTPFWDWFAWNYKSDTSQLANFSVALAEEMKDREQAKGIQEKAALPDCCVTKCRIKIERLFNLSSEEAWSEEFDVEVATDTFSVGKPIGLDFDWSKPLKCQLTIEGFQGTIDLGTESSYRFTVVSLVPTGNKDRISKQVWNTGENLRDGFAEFAPVEFFVELALDKPRPVDAKSLYNSLELNELGGNVEARIKLTKDNKDLLRIGRVDLSQQIWYWDGRNFDQSSSPFNGADSGIASEWDAVGFGNRFDHDCRTRRNRLIVGANPQLIYTEDRSKVLRGDLMRFALCGYDRYLGLRPNSRPVDVIRNEERWQRLYVQTKLTDKLPPPSIRFINQLAHSIGKTGSQSAAVVVVFNDRWFAAAGVAEKLEARIVKVKVKVGTTEEEFFNAGVDPTLSAMKTPVGGPSENPLKIRGPFAFTFDKVARTPELVRTAFALELDCTVVEKWISTTKSESDDCESSEKAKLVDKNVTLASFLCQVQFRRVVREWNNDSSVLDSEWCDPVWVEFTPNAGEYSLVPVVSKSEKNSDAVYLTFSLRYNKEFEEQHERWLILLKQQRDIRGEFVNVFERVIVPHSTEKEVNHQRTIVKYTTSSSIGGDYIASILLVRKGKSVSTSDDAKMDNPLANDTTNIFKRIFGELSSGLADSSTIRSDADVARPLLGPSFPLKILSSQTRVETQEPFEPTNPGVHSQMETFHETIAVLMERITELEKRLVDKNTGTQSPSV
jgi:hypothetical protein